MDEQHKKLVELLNLLASHIAFQSDSIEINDIFEQLTDYTIYHFDTEEEIWNKALSGDEVELLHKDDHARFIATINELKLQVNSSKKDEVIEQALAFLTRWLVSHILESDRYMALYTLAVQSGLSNDEAKLDAENKIKGSNKILIDVLLSTYETLSSNTLHLIREVKTRSQLNHKLFESEYHLNKAMNYAQIGYWEWSTDKRTTTCSEQIYQLFGLAKDNTPIQKSLSQITDKADYQRFIASIESCIATGQEHHIEFELTRPSDGQKRWIESRGKLISTNGHAEKISGFIQDITNRKQTDQKIRLAATLFQSQEGMFICDANNHILQVNRAFTEITGFEESDVIGKNPNILRSDRHDDAFYADMWTQIYSKGHWKGEVWNTRKNGECFPEFLTITAVRDSFDNTVNYVATITDITQQKNAEHRIEQLAFYDPLTLLPNRRLLFDRLSQAAASSVRNNKNIAVLYFDIDQFKILNDTHGHDYGDMLLMKLARRITDCLRETDTLARIGGDEFVIILKDLSENSLAAATEVETITDKITSSLSAPFQLGEYDYSCSISTGVVVYKDHSLSTSELMKQADIAMYQAKRAGRNTVRFFDPNMQTEINARAELESELRLAIEQQHLVLYYQVQTDSQQRVIGAEGLLRWRHPKRGIISPAEFIPLAEETGLILTIGDWVLNTACAQLKRWQADSATRHLSLSINVSATQFRQADFVTQIKEIVEKYDIDLSYLVLELTESLLLDNIEQTIAQMAELGELGIKFSLDDFGTGYSSLQYLKRLPLHELKIDQSFVHDLINDSSDQSIIRTIISMAQELGLEVIAEGVETIEQQQYLLSKGCQRFQGYLFGKPAEIDKLGLDMPL